MNTRRFVSGSSLLLAAWLGATFFNDVPETKYPKLDKGPQPSAFIDEPGDAIVSRQVKANTLSGSAWH